MSNLGILDWLHTAFPGERSLVNPTACDHRVALGKMDRARWLHKHEYEFTKAAMDRVAERGDLETVEFVHEHRDEGCTSAAFSSTARNRYLDLAKYFHVNCSSTCTTEAMDIAAQQGKIDMVKFLHEIRFEGCTTDAMNSVTTYYMGNCVEPLHHRLLFPNPCVETLRFLHHARHDGCTTAAMDNVAANRIQVVTFLLIIRHERGSPGLPNYVTMMNFSEMLRVLFVYSNQGS